eukprot:scaffold78_cov265-Pinguiococcus_pyrenoidosus.AAC.6
MLGGVCPWFSDIASLALDARICARRANLPSEPLAQMFCLVKPSRNVAGPDRKSKNIAQHRSCWLASQ